mmetsp:Transcript_10721/g.14155  ORF Transcript_10721/g.14155 Transcript_10721/m.14155 type:complete len:94 (+) Transcript_10721:1181-1462(+)
MSLLSSSRCRPGVFRDVFLRFKLLRLVEATPFSFSLAPVEHASSISKLFLLEHLVLLLGVLFVELSTLELLGVFFPFGFLPAEVDIEKISISW